MAHSTARIGGDILAKALAQQGVSHVFGVPGESYLPLLIALNSPEFPTIRYVMARNEGGAATMAEAAGKITAHRGIPGVVAISRGPGLTNAINGIYTAAYDGTPLLVLIGSIPTRSKHRKPFQEISYEKVLGFCKHIIEIDSAERVSELTYNAIRAAFDGVPGPVALVLPEQILAQSTEAADWPAFAIEPEVALALSSDVETKITTAKKPVVVMQGCLWNQTGMAAIEAYATKVGAPVLTGFRSQDTFDNQHANYVGHFGIVPEAQQLRCLDESDCLMVIGAPLECLGSQNYSHPTPEQTAQNLILVSPVTEPNHGYYPHRHRLYADPNSFALKLAELADRAVVVENWVTRAPALPSAPRPPRNDMVDPAVVIAELSKQTQNRPTVVASGAGNSTVWLHQGFAYRPLHVHGDAHSPKTGWRAQLAPIVGTMGYGVPAAVAGKLLMPNALAVASMGDGCFQMTALEMMTAKQYNAPLLAIVFDNTQHGSIRMHQARLFPGSSAATEITSPDWLAFAQAVGAHGVEIRTEAGIADQMAAAIATVDAGQSVLMVVHQDPDLILPDTLLSDKYPEPLA